MKRCRLKNLRAAKRSAPRFAETACVTVTPRTDAKFGELLDVTFPPAEPVAGCRAFEYEVSNSCRRSAA